MDLEKIVIENIRRIRKERGITQEKLAELCGTTVGYIGHVETFKYVPKISTLQKLAEALNINPVEFFMQKDDIASDERKDRVRERVKRQILNDIEREIDAALKIL